MRLALLLLLALPAHAQTKALLILADDLNAQDVAAATTPTLDWLAATGRSYTRHHGEAACSVSRASLLTGHHAKDHLIGGIFFPQVTGWSMDVTAPDVLPKLVPGRSVFIGKWHVGEATNYWHPVLAGFDEWWGTTGNLGQEDYFGWTEVHVGQGPPSATFRTDYLTTRQGALALQEVLTDTPFILWAAHAIHEPVHWPPPDLYTPGAPDERTAMLEALDTVMGRVVRTARSRGYLVIFTSDNGGPKGGGKANLYEQALHTPLLVSGPSVPQGCSQALTTWSTVRSWCVSGWSRPTVEYQIHDRFPGVKDFKPAEWDRSVNDRRWKLLVQDGGASSELYDLQSDPTEQVNLYPPSTQEQQDAYRRLLQELPQ